MGPGKQGKGPGQASRGNSTGQGRVRQAGRGGRGAGGQFVPSQPIPVPLPRTSRPEGGTDSGCTLRPRADSQGLNPALEV